MCSKETRISPSREKIPTTHEPLPRQDLVPHMARVFERTISSGKVGDEHMYIAVAHKFIPK